MKDHEKAIIGLIINNPDLFHITKGQIDTIDFSEKNSGLIWLEMKKLDDQGLPTSRQYVTSAIIESRKSEMYYQPLIDYISDACRYFEGDILVHCKHIKDAAKHRNLLISIAHAKNHPDPAGYMMAELEKYYSTNNDDSMNFKDLIVKAVDFIESCSDGVTGLKTGIPELDRIMGGFHPSRVYTIAARPSVGKTALTMQIGLFMASEGVSVGVCSLEMGDDELGIRSLSTTCQASITKLYRADDLELSKVSAGMKNKGLTNWPIYFNTEQYEINEILSQLRIWKTKHDIKAAIIDHIGLVEVKTAKSALERVTHVTRELKKISKVLDIAIIQTSQLNRKIEEAYREPRLSDLRDSGSIEQDSDVVMFLHEEKDKEGDYVKHNFFLAKNRQGAKGAIGGGFYFNGAVQTFEPISFSANNDF